MERSLRQRPPDAWVCGPPSVPARRVHERAAAMATKPPSYTRVPERPGDGARQTSVREGVAHQAYIHSVDMGYDLVYGQVLELVRGQPWTREDHRSWRPPGEYISEIIEEILRGALSRANPGDAERDQE